MKNKDHPKTEVSCLKRTISSLKAKVSQRDRKIDRLLTDIKTLQTALDKSIIYINDELADIPVEDIVRYFKNKKKGKLDSAKNEFDRIEEKWQCHKCEVGYLRLVVLDRVDGKKYFRICVNAVCKHRTKLKDWHPEVDGRK